MREWLQLLQQLQPWIYRRYLNRADISGIKSLKRRIEQRGAGRRHRPEAMPDEESADLRAREAALLPDERRTTPGLERPCRARLGCVFVVASRMSLPGARGAVEPLQQSEHGRRGHVIHALRSGTAAFYVQRWRRRQAWQRKT